MPAPLVVFSNLSMSVMACERCAREEAAVAAGTRRRRQRKSSRGAAPPRRRARRKSSGSGGSASPALRATTPRGGARRRRAPTRPAPRARSRAATRLEHVADVGVEHHAAHDDFVEDVVDLVGVEDEVQLAHVFKALVEHLDKDLDQVEDAQLRLAAVDDEDKVERRVVPVDDARVLPVRRDAPAVDEVAHVVAPLRDDRENVADDRLLQRVRLRARGVGGPRGEAGGEGRRAGARRRGDATRTSGS